MPRRLHGTIPGASLSEQERERQRRYFEPAYRSDLAMLAAMVPNSGRNRRCFSVHLSVRTLGARGHYLG